MPRWWVSEPNNNLWLHDVPLRCQPAYGKGVGPRITFKQRDEFSFQHIDVSNFGPGWNCHWLSYVDNRYYVAYQILLYVDVYMPGGGSLHFEFPQGQTVATDYFLNARLTALFTEQTV
ncbi:MAG: hypothetical protein FJ387_19290, partial [Verrucomicrobia bacterium]|nr:hypothetical protein [Verrucomicrobiota bacterium]